MSHIRFKHEASEGGNKSISEEYELSDAEEQLIVQEDCRIRAEQQHCDISLIPVRSVQEILQEVWAEEERACHHFFRTDVKQMNALCSFETEEEEKGEIGDPNSLDPLYAVEQAEEKDKIDSLMKQMTQAFPHLTAQQKEVLRALYWRGERAAELSKNKGVSRAAISRQHSRALAALLREMRKENTDISMSFD